MRKEYSSLLYYLCEPEMVEETAAKEAGFHRNVLNRRSIG